MPNPTTRAEAKQMMLAALAGETVNGARLAAPGACSYLTEETGRTCIVGCLMTPEQRQALKEENELVTPIVQLLWQTPILPGSPLSSAFGGLTPDELNQLQKVFDEADDGADDGEDFPQTLAKLCGLIEAMPD